MLFKSSSAKPCLHSQDEVHSSKDSLEALLRLAPKFLRHVVLREGVVLGQGEVWQLLERAEAQVIGQGRVFFGRKNYDGVSVSVGQLKWTGGLDGLK